MNSLNARALRIAYEQYFCNVCDLTDTELLSAHFKFDEALNKDEYVSWCDPALDNLVIWQPMEEVLPMHVFDNIVELTKRLADIHEETDTDVTRAQSVLEAAVELAAVSVEKALAEGEPEGYFASTYLVSLDNGDIIYNEEAQNLFNEAYENYLTTLKLFFG